MSKLSREHDAKVLEDAAHTVATSWFTMHIADDEAHAKMVHDWLMRRAQWLRGEEETYGLAQHSTQN